MRLAHEAGHAVGEAGLPLAPRETLEDLGHAYEPGGKAGLRAHGTARRVPSRNGGFGQPKALSLSTKKRAFKRALLADQRPIDSDHTLVRERFQ